MSGYNATAWKRRANGSLFSVEKVEVDGDGRVIRASGHLSPLDGTPEFERMWEDSQFSEVDLIHIEEDGTRGYREQLKRLPA